MNNAEIQQLANRLTPKVKLKVHDNYHRHDVLEALKGNNNLGIELGVAGGHYSKRMVQSGKFKRFYGVDLYEDHHDTKEYISALKLVGIEEDYTLLRMSFDDAIELFEDTFFDFIYFDGYAHTGEEGGKTFSDWYRKLKVGGVFAGDDYHDDWPLVKWAVNDIVSKLDCELNITGKVENTHLNRYPSWFFTKEKEHKFKVNEELRNLGIAIRNATREKTTENFSITAQQLEAVLKQVKDKNPEMASMLKTLL
jgi:SAM-dependent methyltransferase